MTQILLSSRTDEWYTPQWLIDKCNKVLGPIDLDPASSELANETIQARKIFTRERGGLSNDWPDIPSTVFLNPPGGRPSLTKPFWDKLIEYRNSGLLVHAIFIGFSLEQLQTTQLGCTDSIADYPICIPKRRVKYVSPTGEFNSPTHGTVIAYVPGLQNSTSRFVLEFSEVGRCMFPYP